MPNFTLLRRGRSADRWRAPFRVALAAFLASAALQTTAADGERPMSANERMLQPGPQTAHLQRMAGTWEAVMTLRTSPNTPPIVVKGLLVERTMIGGQYLQEVMTPGPSATTPDFRRISYLLYNKADNRWEYSSIDTRVASIMTRANFGNEPGAEITFHMATFTLPGFGPEFEGRAVRLREVMRQQSNDRDELLQYWTPAGGVEWLAVHYQYTRKR